MDLATAGNLCSMTFFGWTAAAEPLFNCGRRTLLWLAFDAKKLMLTVSGKTITVLNGGVPG